MVRSIFNRLSNLFFLFFWHTRLQTWHALPLLYTQTVLSPCIMCVQYRGGCSVPWEDIMSTVGDILSTVGVFSTVGDILSTVGDIMSTMEGYFEYRGGYHEYHGELFWVPWGISWCTWGDIMSTVGDVQYRGGIPSFEIWVPWGISWVTWGCSVPWGTQITKIFPPTVLNTPTVLMISPHVHHDILPRYWVSPRYSRYLPTALMISPHGTEHPHGTQDIPPHLSWYPLRYWTPPRYSRYPPRYSWYPPRYWTPPAVLHTLYRVIIFTDAQITVWWQSG